jgi:hypothetical protein
MEGLTKHWGFYLVALPDINGVGVTDLSKTLDQVIEYNDWVTDLQMLPSEQRASQAEANCIIVRRLLKKVLVARAVVFQLFLELAIEVDGSLQERHKRIWLLFQSFDQLDPQVRTSHPFVRVMMDCLPYASDHALDVLIRRLNSTRSAYLPFSNFIIALDEAQRVAISYPRSFLSSDRQTFRSILREIVHAITLTDSKLIVSGTGLSLKDVEEPVISGVSKPDDSVKLFHRLGMFDTWLKLKPFLRRYIPTSVLESPSGLRLQQRIREYLLGR